MTTEGTAGGSDPSRTDQGTDQAGASRAPSGEAVRDRRGRRATAALTVCALLALRNGRRRPRRPVLVPAVLALLLVGVGAVALVRGRPAPVDSQPIAAAAELLLADDAALTAASPCAAAAPYVDAQTVSPMSVSGAAVGATATRFVCIYNAGSEPAALAVAMVDTASTETGCRGDEPAVDPDGPTCGTSGELAGDVAVEAGVTDLGTAGCGGAPADPVTYAGVADTGASDLSALLPAGGYACIRVDAAYLAFTPAVEVQQNQSDRATWRFRLTGTAAEAPNLSLDKALIDQAGDTATWRLRVTNHGPGAVAGPITVIDDLPVGLTYASSAGGGFSCSGAGRTVTCTRAAALDDGDTAVLTLESTIEPGTTGDLTNHAEVFAAGAEADPSDNADGAVLALSGPTTTTTTAELPPSGGGPSFLAATGADPGRWVVTASALLVLGLALVAFARRRRRPPVA